jgi:membrane protease YdiL (CAAX protease family)
MYIVGILTLLPVELGYLYYQGKKLNGIFSLKGIVLYREKMPWWQYIVFGFIALVWILIVFLGFGPQIMGFIETHLFSWIPDWYWLSRGTFEQNAPSVEIMLWILGFILVAVCGPIIEELYFRGYLLPRLSRFGRWAPLINVFLFSLYHFWQPHFLVIGIISLLPLVYIVWWKRNIYLSIGLHCFINTLGWTMELIQRLSS